MSEEIKDVEGKSVNSEYVKLSMWMLENNYKQIHIEYSGSGDSGNIEVTTEGIPEDIQDLVSNIFVELVNPDFNNSGSYGEATFIMIDGKLKFQCAHSDVIETTDDTSYDKDLLDTSML